MAGILHSPVSVIHLAATVVALGTGTYSLLTRKGTRRHYYLGRVYVGSMLLVLVTAFCIYTLFGRFGIVHWGAVGSAVALLVGTGSVALRSAVPGWRQWHYLGMGTSVISLYAAMAGESIYRLLPTGYFWWSTMGPASVVLVGGALLLYRHYPVAPRRPRTSPRYSTDFSGEREPVGLSN
jgi:uncharacterized membrane protein